MTATLDFERFLQLSAERKDLTVRQMLDVLNAEANHYAYPSLSYGDLYILCEFHAHWRCTFCGRTHDEAHKLTAEFVFPLNITPYTRATVSNVRIVCSECSREGRRLAAKRLKRTPLKFVHVTPQGEQIAA